MHNSMDTDEKRDVSGLAQSGSKSQKMKNHTPQFNKFRTTE